MSTTLQRVNTRIDGIISGWHAEHAQASRKTAITYAPMLQSFRGFLLDHGLDLDSLARDVAYHAQAWAAQPNKRTGNSVTPATHNLRLAAVTSFYEYAIRHEELTELGEVNPLARVKRMKREPYKGARAMPFGDGEMDNAIAAIPTDKLNGLRDRALLSLALYTGRRLSEIASLKCGALSLSSVGMTIEWEYTKGGKSARNILPNACPAVGHLARWLKRYYGSKWRQDALVFPCLSRNNEGGRMSSQGIEYRAAKWLPTGGKFHALRHTFAMAFLEAGGTVQELSTALGHSSIGTTSAYVDKLDGGHNQHIDAMINVFAGKKK
jgi:site-specific recombinase XerD